MNDADALKALNSYLKNQVEVIIKPKPDHFWNDGPIVVVPVEDSEFVLSDFSTVEDAEEFCKRSGLPVSEVQLGAQAPKI